MNQVRSKEVEESKSQHNTSANMADPNHRSYIDGCFDLMHAGHFNAIRQASYLTPWLVVGPNSDEQILKMKGPTVLNSKERQAICRSLKWTDEVIADSPYVVDEKLLDDINCRYYIHGDDPVYDWQGNNLCETLAAVGRYKMIKRTTGISTTDLTGRLLELLDPIDEENEERQGA